jgi:prephenate dehydrogenase
VSGTDARAGGHVAICGGGLIGASLTTALAARGHVVVVHDRDPAVRDELRTMLAAAPAPAATVSDDWAGAARGAAIVVAAVPPDAVAQVLVEAAALAPSALLTDVAGVKGSIVDAALAGLERIPGAAVRFVGGHPMAGSERSGPRAADASLFSGATWVLTPTAVTADGTLAAAGDLARELGARVLVLAPDEHDVIVGLVSHLPQLVASVLADVAAEAVGAERDAVMAVAGPGFRDTTRIAASDAALWLSIIDGNRSAIGAALGAFQARLQEVVGAIAARDVTALGTILQRASAARRRLLPKGVDEPTRHLVVPLRDRPGEIARIAGALGSAGINIEDLAMRHATTGDRGSLLLRVRAATVARASEVLAAADVDGVVVEEDLQGPDTQGSVR